MKNAKDELQSFLLKHKVVLEAADIWYDPWFRRAPIVRARLPADGGSDEVESFWRSLDFAYDNGHGGQELFGIVWLRGGMWADRSEYDGSEWWQLCARPDIPDDLRAS